MERTTSGNIILLKLKGLLKTEKLFIYKVNTLNIKYSASYYID